MKKTTLFFISIVLMSMDAILAQNSVTLTFSCETTNGNYCQPDSITIENISRDWIETIYYPDTVYTLNIETGVHNNVQNNGIQIMPNPFDGFTRVNVQSLKTEKVEIRIIDMSGGVCADYKGVLQEGGNLFAISLKTPKTYVFSVRTQSGTVNLKMENIGHAGVNNIAYEGSTGTGAVVQLKSESNYEFQLGDEMRYTGYITYYDSLIRSIPITQNQNTSENVTLQFEVFEVGPPVVITSSVNEVSGYAAQCGGEVLSDGNQEVTDRGICWSVSPAPSLSDSVVACGQGTGSFVCQLTGLLPGTTYYVRAYATNSMGTTYGDEQGFTTVSLLYLQACPDLPEIVDYDGNIYHTVQIGQQCWMRENLRTTHFADGSPIALGSSSSSLVPYRYCPDNDSSNVELYGYLYNWPAAMGDYLASDCVPSGVRGICPDGWHLPSDSEWGQLTSFVGSQSEYILGNNSSYIAKALADSIGWTATSGINNIGYLPGQNNATGFSARPAGERSIVGIDDFGNQAIFWTTSFNYTPYIYCRYLSAGYSVMYGTMKEIRGAVSVRCILDDNGGDVTRLPSVSTRPVLSVTATSATLGGNVTSYANSAVTAGVCWSTQPMPSLSDNFTTDMDRNGGFVSNITGLSPGTTYYARSWATNNVGTSYGQVVEFTTAPAVAPCANATSVTDIDNNVYAIVQIGSQCWMAENLRVTRYANGNPIVLGDVTNDTIPHYYYPNEDNANALVYGLLYTWNTVMHNTSASSNNPSNVQGICPDGWHIPSGAEWTELINYVRSQDDYLCSNQNVYLSKALADETGWRLHYEYVVDCMRCTPGYNPSANNATGFGARPAGFYSVGCCDWYRTSALYWSTTETSETAATKIEMSYNSPLVNSGDFAKSRAISVRCLRN